jgi:hypothetical protein
VVDRCDSYFTPHGRQDMTKSVSELRVELQPGLPKGFSKPFTKKVNLKKFLILSTGLWGQRPSGEIVFFFFFFFSSLYFLNFPKFSFIAVSPILILSLFLFCCAVRSIFRLLLCIVSSYFRVVGRGNSSMYFTRIIHRVLYYFWIYTFEPTSHIG